MIETTSQETALHQNVVTYLSRLTGEKLVIDTPLRLRSVQRAAFSSWARQQQLPVKLSVISSTIPFTIQQLLGVDAETPNPALPSAQVKTAAQEKIIAAPAAAGMAPVVGIDIEEVENLPVATDYRSHPFYEDNFTAAEISFCIRQPNVRASFCGSWAAKEAILKAGVADAPAGHLKAIEILRDDAGRPLHPGCSISISHTARTAVAVCTAMATA